jgi:hypothetical protein
MMVYVRRLGLLGPLLIAGAAIAVLTLALIALGSAVPSAFEAFLAASSIVLAIGSWAVWNNPRLYFWRLRMSASLGRKVAPAWRLSVTYRSKRGPDDPAAIAGSLEAAGLACETISSRTVQVLEGSTRLVVHWDEPVLDDDGAGAPDWIVNVEADYPPVPYSESIRFLRHDVMPVLESLEISLQATPARLYHLRVAYAPGRNPFEGLLIRATPDVLVTHYSVLLKPEGTRDEKIELSREAVSLEATSRSRFEQLVERLLTLDGSWPVAFLDSVR